MKPGARSGGVLQEIRRCFQWIRSPHSWSFDGSAVGSIAHNDQLSLSPEGGHCFAQTGTQVIYFQALREQDPVLRSFRWKGYWACLMDDAPSGAPALALYPSPASRRPIRTQLGTPNSRTSGPLFLQPCTRPSRSPRRSLTVVPSIWIEGTTVRLRRGSDGATEMSGR